MGILFGVVVIESDTVGATVDAFDGELAGDMIDGSVEAGTVKVFDGGIRVEVSTTADGDVAKIVCIVASAPQATYVYSCPELSFDTTMEQYLPLVALLTS